MSCLLPMNPLGRTQRLSSCALYLSDNDVFSGLSLKRLPNSRGNLETPERPFLYDVICNRSKGSAANLYCDRRWWSQTGSNRRPHACKARALPTELWPQILRSTQESCLSIRSAATQELVGPGRFELPTLRLSGVRSNQLSYGPPWSYETSVEGGAAQTD